MALMRARETEAGERNRLGALVQAALDGRHLPRFFFGEPAGLAGATAANQTAGPFLEALARQQGVRRWDHKAYERVVLRGALAAWRPGTNVTRTPDGWRVVSPVCPLAGEAELDPRACQYCQAFQNHVAQSALDDPGAEVRFEHLIVRGDAACVATVKTTEKRPERT